MKSQKKLTKLVKYLQSTQVATRKWQLNLIDSEAWQHQRGWEEIEDKDEEEEEEEEKEEEEENV